MAAQMMASYRGWLGPRSGIPMRSVVHLNRPTVPVVLKCLMAFMPLNNDVATAVGVVACLSLFRHHPLIRFVQRIYLCVGGSSCGCCYRRLMTHVSLPRRESLLSLHLKRLFAKGIRLFNAMMHESYTIFRYYLHI